MVEGQEMENAAVGLEERLKEFDAPKADILDDFLGDAEEEPPKEEPPKEEPPKEEPPKEEPADDLEVPEPSEESPKEDDADEIPPANWSQKSRDGWNALKASKAEFKRQFEEADSERGALKAKVEELEKQLAEFPEYKEKAKFFEEAEKELAVARVEGTREYKETIAAPLKAIEEAAEAIAADNEISLDRLFDAMSQPDPAKRRKALKEVTEDMDGVDRDEVFRMARDTQELLVKQSQIRAKAQEAAKEAKTNAEQRQAAETRKWKEDYAKAADYVVEELGKRIHLGEMADGESKEAVLGGILKAVKASDTKEESAHDIAVRVASTVFLKRANEQLKKAMKKIEDLEGQLDSKTRKKPRLGGSAPEVSGDEEDDMDLDDIVSTRLGLARSRDIVARLE